MSKADPRVDEWLRPSEARARLKISRGTLHKYLTSGLLKKHEVKRLPSGQHRYLAAGLDRLSNEASLN